MWSVVSILAFDRFLPGYLGAWLCNMLSGGLYFTMTSYSKGWEVHRVPHGGPDSLWTHSTRLTLGVTQQGQTMWVAYYMEV